MIGRTLITFALMLSSLLTASAVLAATRYVAVNGNGSLCTQTTPCALQTALTNAQAGDQIILGDGTYSGNFTLGTNSGTSQAPIHLKADVPHKAILAGRNDPTAADTALLATAGYWIIDGLKIRNYSTGIKIQGSSASNVEVRNNLIHDLYLDGIFVDGANDVYIHHNAIAFSTLQNADMENYSGVRLYRSNNGRIQDNIIYSFTDDGYQAFVKRGYAIYLAKGSNGNLVQGNLTMDGAKGTIRVFSGPNDAPIQYNTVKDNIVAFSEGPGIVVNDTASNFNRVTNNIFYSTYLYAFGAKGNNPGQNTFDHNTVVVTPFALYGGQFTGNDFGVYSLQTTLKNNLYYSAFSAPGETLLKISNWSATIKESNYNLYWRPGNFGSLFSSGVQLAGKDIADPAKRPMFVDEAAGDFSLLPGSPGKSAASDGADIGATFNASLKKEWMKNIIALPTQEKSATATSISFSSSSAHQYQIYVYVPETNPYNGNERFVIEGKNVDRDFARIHQGRWLGDAPTRWIYLGTHPNDGVLNISWQHTNAAAKVFIRQLPTVTEAYSWIFPASIPGSIPAAPTLLPIVSSLP